jgi:uncharacterized membrane protein
MATEYDKNTLMKKRIAPGVMIPVFATFYVMGFVDLVGMATGYVKDDFQLSDSLAQLLPSMVFLWFALLSGNRHLPG